jgi:pre-rRNA-processing protein TSR3
VTAPSTTSSDRRVVILRHPKEYLPKCTLEPLRGRPGIEFHKAKEGFRLDATGMTLLQVDAPTLSSADAGRPLLVLDATWRLLPALVRCIHGEFVPRSLPRTVHTAYPRRSKVFTDPETGLASIEALYAALRILGRDDRTLLDAYHWRDEFLRQFDAIGA